MRIVHFDCYAGAAGDMLLASLIDAGAAEDRVTDLLRGLPVPHPAFRTEIVERAGLRARRAIVSLEKDPPARDRAQIRAILDAARLPPPVLDRARRVFDRLFEAEARVHGMPAEAIHLHEVAATDALVDIVGTAAALHVLGVEECRASAVAVGSGTIRAEHGTLPVPAPATLELLQGVPVVCGPPGERCTPTGAALLTALAAGFGSFPDMTPRSIGWGAGSRDDPEIPNAVRATLGETGAAPGAAETVSELVADIDDATPQIMARAAERLLQEGALDAHIVPIIMKKGRPGFSLRAVVRERDADRISRLVLEETPTFGVRRHPCSRLVLERTVETVETPFGPIRVKVGRVGEVRLRAMPEHDDCREAALRAGVPFTEVYRVAAARAGGDLAT